MPIISVSFLLFVAAAFLGYFILPLKIRPYWLLAASLAFYGCFDLRYFIFFLFSVFSAYFAAYYIGTRAVSPIGKKCVLAVAVLLNIGLLAVVKYLNYSLSLIGMLTGRDFAVVSVIVPLGIAFYSMQAVSYCVDVYRGKNAPERNPLNFLLYMSYFPIIMQGPISRYDQLAPELFTPHKFSFERLKSGMLLFMYGVFKKIVIADRAAIFVNQVFGNYNDYQGFEIIIAMVLYTIQIYTDFSGCVDISRGVSEVLGIKLINNFDHPYFAVSIKDFWRRWHISLSTWFRDYIYIPLGGNRKGKLRKHANLFIVFLVSGLWHGVGVHYIVWGMIHGFYQIFGELTASPRDKFYEKCGVNKNTFSFKFGRQLTTFVLVTVAWLFFRADGFIAGCRMLRSAFVLNPWVLTDDSLFEIGLDGKDWNVLLLSIAILLVVSLLQGKYSLREELQKQTCWFRYTIYILALLFISIFGVYGPGYNVSQFIYMQF
ncbi:MAG: MBOAT family protein [Ruminococcaceae bacterium]|nr:MBOAT family protein [Oscillospiraceae bacterium]